jgi:hypothetical protein
MWRLAGFSACSLFFYICINDQPLIIKYHLKPFLLVDYASSVISHPEIDHLNNCINDVSVTKLKFSQQCCSRFKSLGCGIV